jgi:hypothetical protein
MACSGRASTMPFIYDDLSAPLKPGVAMTSNVKSGQQIF